MPLRPARWEAICATPSRPASSTTISAPCGAAAAISAGLVMAASMNTMVDRSVASASASAWKRQNRWRRSADRPGPGYRRGAAAACRRQRAPERELRRHSFDQSLRPSPRRRRFAAPAPETTWRARPAFADPRVLRRQRCGWWCGGAISGSWRAFPGWPTGRKTILACIGLLQSMVVGKLSAEVKCLCNMIVQRNWRAQVGRFCYIIVYFMVSGGHVGG